MCSTNLFLAGVCGYLRAVSRVEVQVGQLRLNNSFLNAVEHPVTEGEMTRLFHR